MPIYIVVVEMVITKDGKFYFYRILEVIESSISDYNTGKHRDVLGKYYGTVNNPQVLLFEREPDNPLRKWGDK